MSSAEPVPRCDRVILVPLLLELDLSALVGLIGSSWEGTTRVNSLA